MATVSSDFSGKSSGFPGDFPSNARQRDAERTKAEILDMAARTFAAKGFDGARVEEIAARTRTTKRMIYYYFESKEKLFVAVLEHAYTVVGSLERAVDVEHLDPVDALRRIAELTFDHHESHPDVVRLVSIENIHRAEHITGSTTLSGYANPALEVLTRILARGRAAGQFRDNVDALDVHMAIDAFCVFRTTNRYTFNAIFHRDLLDPRHRDRHRRMLGDMLQDYLTVP